MEETRFYGMGEACRVCNTSALRWFFLLSVLLFGGLYAMVGAKPAVAQVPEGFDDKLVADVGKPTALAFTPDERMLISTQPGQLLLYENGALLEDAALDLASEICAQGERGLLGVAVDPAFTSNNYVYLYYTSNESGECRNRVSRFVLSGDVATFDKLLLETVYSGGASNHNAGDLHFGKDGYLYISIGDLGCDYAGDSGCAGANDAARDEHALVGKILRITRDGEIPPGNPYQGSNSARCNETGETAPGKRCQETFASGLRNPFRMAFDPNADETRFFINDVGQNAWEEVNEGAAGANYGWNVREGFCATGSTTNCRQTPGAVVGGYTDPIHAYGRGVGSSITGGAFVPNGVWPAKYDGSYLFGDYVSGKIFRLTPKSGGRYERTEFVTGLGGSSAVAMTFGPHTQGQALYYTTYQNGGQVRRVSYAGSENRAPIAALTAEPTSGTTPLKVKFDGSGSSDPDANRLTYLWDFGDGTTAKTREKRVRHTYKEKGSYTATLRVRDSYGAISAPETVQIDAGNAPPEPVIDAPTPKTLFSVGQEITLTGSAADAEDDGDEDPETAPVLRWEVIRHHRGEGGSHTHPFFSGTGNNLTFTAPPPEDLLSTGKGNHLEIRLTATDSQGLSRTISQKLQPRRVDLEFRTLPTGLRLRIDDTALRAPGTLTSWTGHELDVFAPDQTRRGTTYVFASWSDGGAARHSIVVPSSPATYTATFDKQR